MPFDFSNAPIWMQAAAKELGMREVGDNAGPNVARYIKEAKCGALGEPWCAIFVNAKLETSNVQGTLSPSSQSFRHSRLFMLLTAPCIGAIVVFWRDSRASGLGHVGFYAGESADFVYTLGGNEGDMVQIEPFPKSSPRFGLVGYYWPVSVPVPSLGAVTVAAGTPSHTLKVT